MPHQFGFLAIGILCQSIQPDKKPSFRYLVDNGIPGTKAGTFRVLFPEKRVLALTDAIARGKMQSAGKKAIRNIVIDKNISKYPIPEAHILLPDLNKACPVHPQLCIPPGIFRICSVLLQKESICIKICFARFKEPLIFPSGHGNIRIIIPGNISFMTHCA